MWSLTDAAWVSTIRPVLWTGLNYRRVGPFPLTGLPSKADVRSSSKAGVHSSRPSSHLAAMVSGSSDELITYPTTSSLCHQQTASETTISSMLCSCSTSKAPRKLLFWWRPQCTSQRKSGILCAPFNHPTTHLPVPAVPRSGHLGGKRKMAWKEMDHRCLSQHRAHSESKWPGLEAGESGARKWVSRPRSPCSPRRSA